MQKKPTPLAWSKYPEPDGTIYTADDLSIQDSLVGLFDSCQNSEGYINADGWAFLFDMYGMDTLLEIAADCKWFTISVNTPKSILTYQSFLSGYNPMHKEMGDYDPDTGFFLTMDGNKRRIDWEGI